MYIMYFRLAVRQYLHIVVFLSSPTCDQWTFPLHFISRKQVILRFITEQKKLCSFYHKMYEFLNNMREV